MNEPEPDEQFVLPGTGLLDIFRKMLDDYEYRYEVLDGNAVRLTMRVSGGLVPILITTCEEPRSVRILGSLATYMPLDRRVAAAELASRINFDCLTGGFDVDMSDGEVRYRIGIALADAEFTVAAADVMLGYTIAAVNDHLENFMNVGFAGMEPEAAMLLASE